jgi:hypothetical protein
MWPADLAGKAGKYSEKAALAGLILIGIAVAAWAVGVRLPSGGEEASVRDAPLSSRDEEPCRR